MITNEEYVKQLICCGYVENKAKILFSKIRRELTEVFGFTYDKSLYWMLNYFIEEAEFEYPFNIKDSDISNDLDIEILQPLETLLNLTLIKQKESKMSEFVLTEDISLYQFRNKPDWEILEIQRPKTDLGMKLGYPIRVILKDKKGDLISKHYTIDGFDYSGRKSDSDIILKPQKRPFTHEEILELLRNGSKFRELKNKDNVIELNAYSITYYDSTGRAHNGMYFMQDYEYLLDSKTWHKLEKEV